MNFTKLFTRETTRVTLPYIMITHMTKLTLHFCGQELQEDSRAVNTTSPATAENCKKNHGHQLVTYTTN